MLREDRAASSALTAVSIAGFSTATSLKCAESIRANALVKPKLAPLLSVRRLRALLSKLGAGSLVVFFITLLEVAGSGTPTREIHLAGDCTSATRKAPRIFITWMIIVVPGTATVQWCHKKSEEPSLGCFECKTAVHHRDQCSGTLYQHRLLVAGVGASAFAFATSKRPTFCIVREN